MNGVASGGRKIRSGDKKILRRGKEEAAKVRLSTMASKTAVGPTDRWLPPP